MLAGWLCVQEPCPFKADRPRQPSCAPQCLDPSGGTLFFAVHNRSEVGHSPVCSLDAFQYCRLWLRASSPLCGEGPSRASDFRRSSRALSSLNDPTIDERSPSQDTRGWVNCDESSRIRLSMQLTLID